MGVLVDGKWWEGDLEAYRREPDGRWLGWVRWSEGLAVKRTGWFRDDKLEQAGRC